jgi:hypothetical protein
MHHVIVSIVKESAQAATFTTSLSNYAVTAEAAGCVTDTSGYILTTQQRAAQSAAMCVWLRNSNYPQGSSVVIPTA